MLAALTPLCPDTSCVGSFMTLIAAVEAYRMTGWDSTQKCLVDLYRDFQNVYAANKKDDEGN